MIQYLQRRYAPPRKGAVDNIKGMLCRALQNISFMLPVGLLYRLVGDIMGGTLTAERIPSYAIGCIAAALFIVICTRLEYDNTFLVTYVESGVRRWGLRRNCERSRCRFGKKDLADLTSSIMNDCAVLEQSQSHFVAPLYGAMLSTTVIAVSMLFFQLAHGACRHLAAACGVCHRRAGVRRAEKAFPAKRRRRRSPARTAFRSASKRCPTCAPTTPKALILPGWNRKSALWRAASSRASWERPSSWCPPGFVLRLGIATTALTGATLLVKGELDVLTFFMFLLVVSPACTIL